MFEPPAAVNEMPRHEAPREETRAESYQDQTPVPPQAAPAASAPQRVYTSLPLSFQAVSQHDEVAEEPHRPNRRRKHHGSDETPQEPALQLVETQASPQPVMGDDLPQRTKPRRRRGSRSENEPLQLVETQPSSAEASNVDNPPMP
jgi:hypothetical protein